MRCAYSLALLLAAAMLAGANAQAFNWNLVWAPVGTVRVNDPYPGFIFTITYAGPFDTLFYTFDKDGSSEPAIATAISLQQNVPKTVSVGMVTYSRVGTFNATLRVYASPVKTGGPFSATSLPAWSWTPVLVVPNDSGVRFPPSPPATGGLVCPAVPKPKRYRCTTDFVGRKEVRGTALKPVRVGRNGASDNANECECRKLCDNSATCEGYTYKTTRYCTIFTKVTGWTESTHNSMLDSCEVLA